MTEEERHEIEATLSLCQHCDSPEFPLLISTQGGRHWIVCRQCQMQTPIGTLDEVKQIWNSKRMPHDVTSAINQFAEASAEMARRFVEFWRLVQEDKRITGQPGREDRLPDREVQS